MTVGLSVLATSILVIFVFGVLTGYGLSKWQLATRARRQTAAQISIYRQLRELQAVRKKNYPAQMNVGPFL
jgi:type II secretory pathway pseudopilin PulG